MEFTEVPASIRRLGSRFLGYVLNLEHIRVEELLAGKLMLDFPRAQVLSKLVNVYRGLRVQLLDHDDVDFAVLHALPQLIENDRHLFNVWRRDLGGEIYAPVAEDLVTQLTITLAIESYPIYLLSLSEENKPFTSISFLISALLFQLKKHEELLTLIEIDSSISKMYLPKEIGNGRRGRYMTSSGQGGDIQLEMLPATLITNSYEIMRLRGKVSQTALAKSVEEVVSMIRKVAEGQIVNVPAYVGLHNVGMEGNEHLDLGWAKLSPYNDELVGLIPSEARPPVLAGAETYLGLIVETSYPYKARFGLEENDEKWPSQLKKTRENLNVLQENCSLIFALSIDRTPPIGLASAWTIVVDPLNPGTNISWNHRPVSPVPHYLIENDDVLSLKRWGNIVTSSEDLPIRIAIRRLISSINDRLDPVDGFVDTIIAWENLFGGNAELGFRISVAISKLIATTPNERIQLQKSVQAYYNDRSKILHGVREVSREEAILKRNECLKIGLRCLRKLYVEHKELLNDSERSKTLALQ